MHGHACGVSAAPSEAQEGHALVFVKRSLVSSHPSHYAGGKHAFSCMARTVASMGCDVHIVSICDRTTVMVHAAARGCLGSLHPSGSGVVTWVERTPGEGQSPGGPPHWGAQAVTYHVVLQDELAAPACGTGPSSRVARVVSQLCHQLERQQQPAQPKQQDGGPPGPLGPGLERTSTTRRHCWVIIDADDSQKLATAADAKCEEPSSNGGGGTCLFEAVVAAAPPASCVALVQNCHFLPFGPSGTAPRSGGLLRAWSGLAGVVAVSQFIQNYVTEHWQRQSPPSPPLQRQEQQQLQEQHPLQGGQQDAQQHHQAQPGRPGGGADAAASCLPDVRVVPLSAWRVYGAPPFRDLGAEVLPLVRRRCAAEGAGGGSGSTPWRPLPASPAAGSGPGSAEGDSHRGGEPLANRPREATGGADAALPLPLVCCLKLTPEKGCSVVVELARRLAGRLRFRVVAGDPVVESVLAALPNVSVVAPSHDLDAVLQGCWAVLAPSLWLEAWGMVVTESLLRGLPAVVSDAGALAEAGMGLCPVVHVDPVTIPCSPCTGAPCWELRRYPRQEVQPWEDALVGLLGDAEEWQRLSREGRRAALQHVEDGASAAAGFLGWLGQLAARRGGAGPGARLC